MTVNQHYTFYFDMFLKEENSAFRISVMTYVSYELQVLKGKNVMVNLFKSNQRDNCN